MQPLSLELQSLIEVQDAPFVLIDEDYRIVAANRAYCAAHGVDAAAVVGRACHEVSHHSAEPCHRKGEVCPHRLVFDSGAPCEVFHTHYDRCHGAEHVRLKGHPIRGLDGRLYLGEVMFPLSSSADLDCDEMRMIGQAPAFLECVENLSRVAESEAPILLYGESGVGKELAARFVHQRSARSDKPYIAVNCAAVAEPLFESELFGHERGAFTGSSRRKLGLFELADSGTLFLDEVGEIPLSMQAKLLRVLEAGEFRRVGGTETLRADVRILSATNRNLLDLVDQGRFREDLYYRVAGIDVTLPPLRDRRVDIPALANALLAHINQSAKTRCQLSAEAMSLLLTYDYPGNVRELRNILHKAAALSSNGVIAAAQIQFDSHGVGRRSRVAPAVPVASPATARPPAAGKALSMSEMEARHIAELLAQHDGHRRTVADILGISERTLYRKLNQYGLR